IAAVDIGTSKICALVGKVKEKKIEVLGSATTFSEGVTKGVITDIERVSERIKNAVKNAEIDAGRKVDRLWVSIAGAHIQGQDNQSFVSVDRQEKVIILKDVEEVRRKVSSIVLPEDRELIHVLVQEYIIDGQESVRNPVGMRGAGLQLRAHLITASSGCCRNIEESVRMAGYQVEGLILQPLASGVSTLFPEEQKLGVALLDIGGGTTDLAVFLKEGLRFTKIIAVGGSHLTNDIAVGLHTSPERAETLKIKYGAASVDYLDRDEYLEVERIAGRGKYKVKRSALVHIIQARVEELFEIVDVELKSSGYKGLITAGIVLTGGSSLLPGLKEKAEEKLRLPARIGYPQVGFSEKKFGPAYATGIGLLLWGVKMREESVLRERFGVKLIEWFKNLI
ncbi:cell division protein FtsA, partial [Candidatus Aerophobetes bacterium]|nr:cell division protein FtsA [Candidatus Aerophobetes bacterium]